MRYCIQCGKQRKSSDLFCKSCFARYRQIIPDEQQTINELIQSELEALDEGDEETLRRTKNKLLKVKRVLDDEAFKLNNMRANLIQFISVLNEKLGK